MNKIGIFGLGAIGAVMTKYLYKNLDNDLYFFSRSDKHQLTIESNNEKTIIPISLRRNIDFELDWLLVCLKEFHYAKATSDLSLLINEKTKVAIFRNGIDLKAPFLSFVKPEKLLETIIDCPTQEISSQEYKQIRDAKISLPIKSLSKTFSQLFIGDSLSFQFVKDFEKAQWTKLIESSSLVPIQVVARQPCVIVKSKKYRGVYHRLILEGIKVAQGFGVDIYDSLVDQLMLILTIKEAPC